MIKWAGVRSDELNLVVEHYPKRIFPSRRDEKQVVPGRPGEIVYATARDFNNYDQPYDVVLEGPKQGLPFISNKIAEWLLGHPGYHRLEDNYDPATYRMARYNGGESFTNWFNQYGRGTITFDCMPQRWLKSGEVKMTLKKNQEILNPTGMEALPIFEITGTGATTITITDTIASTSSSLTISSIGGVMTIDAETHYASNASGGQNDKITGSYNSLLLPKKFKVSWTGTGVTKVNLTPRWWTI